MSAGCGDCGGLGWLRYDRPLWDPQFGQLYPCACRVGDHVAKLQADWKITEREAAYTLDDLKPTRGDTDCIVAAARIMAKTPRGLFTIWGTYGNGKSHAGIAMANEVARAGDVAYYLQFADLLDWIRDGFNDKRETAGARFDKLLAARLVVIDEADKYNPTDWAVEFRTRFFDARQRSAQAGTNGLVVILNRDPRSFFPGWIYSRLKSGAIFRNRDQDKREAVRQLQLKAT